MLRFALFVELAHNKSCKQCPGRTGGKALGEGQLPLGISGSLHYTVTFHEVDELLFVLDTF